MEAHLSAQTCVVAMGRYGDLINVLPCVRDIALREGGKCAVVVSAEFASVLEGCSYAESVIVSDHFTDYTPAVEQAKRMFGRVLISKVSEKSIGVTTKCESFNEEAWRQIGYLDHWADLPLVFDRRDREREKALRRKLMIASDEPRKDSPLVLVNFSGKSAPYQHGKEIVKMLMLSPKGARVIDLAEVQAHRIYDLIGLFDVADWLVTVDTSTLHLAAASGIPVVNLIGDKPTSWHGSKPRNNNVLSLRYSEAPEYFSKAKSFGVSQCWKPRTWHVWSDYAMAGDTLRRHQVARATWRDTGWIDFPVRLGTRVVNDPMRSLPFIKDLVNEAVRSAGPRDTIVLTNADTCVAPRAKDECRMTTHECLYSFRRDFARLDGAKTQDEIRRAPQYAGADLFAFTVGWWQKHEKLLPDVVLGAEAWDWCLRVLMRTTGGMQCDDLAYHEKHQNQWEIAEHRHSLPSQLHNKRLAAPFLAGHGVAFS